MLPNCCRPEYQEDGCLLVFCYFLLFATTKPCLCYLTGFVNELSLRFAKTQAFPIEVGVQRIDDAGVQTFVKQKSEDAAAVMSGSLKSCLYFVFRVCTVTNGLQLRVETFCIDLDGEYICQDFTFRIDDEAMLTMKQSCLSLAASIPTRIMMNTSGMFI